jgi:hypothetical protein
MDAGRPKPDLLVHQPGSGEYNHAVIEVKSVAGEDIQKDLETLSLFRNDFGYQRAIYLIYGPDGRVARVRPSPTVFRIWRLSRCGCIWRRAPRRPIYSL